MARKPAPVVARVVRPPPGLSAGQYTLWDLEFGAAPVGHFVPSDVPAMLDHVNLCAEAAEAYQVMIARNRSRDAAAHWRALQSMLLSSRRALRLLPRARVSAKRAGTLAAGPVNADDAVYEPHNRDWRSLFPNASRKG